MTTLGGVVVRRSLAQNAHPPRSRKARDLGHPAGRRAKGKSPASAKNVEGRPTRGTLCATANHSGQQHSHFRVDLWWKSLAPAGNGAQLGRHFEARRSSAEREPALSRTAKGIWRGVFQLLWFASTPRQIPRPAGESAGLRDDAFMIGRAHSQVSKSTRPGAPGRYVAVRAALSNILVVYVRGRRQVPVWRIAFPGR